MEKILVIANLVFSLLPLLVAGVKQIESAFPESGLGDKKVGLLLQLIEESVTSQGGAREQFNDAVPMLRRAIDWIVSLYNSTGAFKKAA